MPLISLRCLNTRPGCKLFTVGKVYKEVEVSITDKGKCSLKIKTDRDKYAFTSYRMNSIKNIQALSCEFKIVLNSVEE